MALKDYKYGSQGPLRDPPKSINFQSVKTLEFVVSWRLYEKVPEVTEILRNNFRGCKVSVEEFIALPFAFTVSLAVVNSKQLKNLDVIYKHRNSPLYEVISQYNLETMIVQSVHKSLLNHL